MACLRRGQLGSFPRLLFQNGDVDRLVGHNPLEPLMLSFECFQPGRLVEAHDAVTRGRSGCRCERDHVPAELRERRVIPGSGDSTAARSYASTVTTVRLALLEKTQSLRVVPCRSWRIIIRLRTNAHCLRKTTPRRPHLRCGILAHGLARTYGSACSHGFLIAFNCKGRDI